MICSEWPMLVHMSPIADFAIPDCGCGGEIGNRSKLGDFLDSLERRIPNKLVQLHPQPSWNVIGDHAFRQFLRVDQTMRAVTGAGRLFAERWGEQNSVDPLRQAVALGEIAGKFVLQIFDHAF